MDIIGHKKIISYLERSIKLNKLNHAYLFSGSEHLGKFTLALDFAQNILGKNEAINPDLLIIRPEIDEKNGIIKKKNISIETIRQFQQKIIMTATFGKFRVAIIDDADYLNTSAQNALLKTLEEPPTNVILILVAHNPEKLLPTIISRCLVKKFNPVSSEDIKNLIGLDCDYPEEVIAWSLNRPGLAKILLADISELQTMRESAKEFQNLFSQTATEKFLLAETMSKDTVAMAKKMNWWLVLARRAMFDSNSAISQRKALMIAECIEKSIQIMRETNSNARLQLENLMLEF